MTTPLHGDCRSWCQACQDEEDRARLGVQRSESERVRTLEATVTALVAEVDKARDVALEEAAMELERRKSDHMFRTFAPQWIRALKGTR